MGMRSRSRTGASSYDSTVNLNMNNMKLEPFPDLLAAAAAGLTQRALLAATAGMQADVARGVYLVR